MRTHLFILVILSFLLAAGAQADEQVLWQTAQSAVENGESVRISMEVEGHEQILYGRAARLDPKDFPDIFALVSNEGVFHMIDLLRLKGTIKRLPPNTDMSQLSSSVHLRSLEARAPSNPEDVQAQERLSEFLASHDRQIENLTIKIRLAPLVLAGLIFVPYVIFWDATSAAPGQPYRPFWANHVSSFILSALPMAAADIWNEGRNLGRVNRSERLLIAAAAVIATMHAALEIKGFAPSFTKFMGPNVSDLADFYVGAGTAGLMIASPWIHRIAWKLKRSKARKSLGACRAFDTNTEMVRK